MSGRCNHFPCGLLWSGTLTTMVTSTDLQSVGGLLIGGFVIFLVGAAFWKLDFQRPLPEALLAIAQSPKRWRWIHTWMIAGVAITIAGLGALARLLAESGELIYGTVGFVLFAVGGIVWLVAAAWRLTALVLASQETKRTGTVPEEIKGWIQWFGVLHSIHLLSAYLSWTFLGSSIVSSGIVPQWLGWLGIGLGAAGVVGYIALKGGPLAPPFLAHLYPFILGIALLVSGQTLP